MIRKILYRVTQYSLYLFFRIYYGLSIKGKENLPKKGGYILAFNHQSFIDPFIIGATVPPRVCFLARTTLWKSRLYRFGDLLFKNTIPIKRGYPDKAALKKAIEKIEEPGWALLLFPEGTRTLDGMLSPIKKGPAFISMRSGFPIVPGIIKGAFGVWPKGKKLPRLLGWPFHRFKVRLGEPIHMAEFDQYPRNEKTIEMTRVLDQRMHELFNET